MHLRIDRAGQDQRRAQIVTFARRGGRAFPDQRHAAIAHGDEAAFHLTLAQDHPPRQDQIEIGHALSSLRPDLPGAARGPALKPLECFIDQDGQQAGDQPALHHEGGIGRQQPRDDHLAQRLCRDS